MKILTKAWRFVAFDDKNIFLVGEFELISTTETLKNYAYDFDTENEMDIYIINNHFILPPE